MTRRIVPILAIAAILSGCVGTAVSQWQAEAEKERSAYVAATQKAADWQTVANALPPGPTRDKAIAASTQASGAAVTAADRYKQLNDIVGAQKADDSAAVGKAVGNLLTGIPYIGPYAPYIGWGAGALLGLIAFIQRAKKATALMHLDNVVKSVEVGGPDWTEADKAQVAAIQGPQTSAAVEAAKKRLGL